MRRSHFAAEACEPAKPLADASSFAYAYVQVNASVPSLAVARGDSPAPFSPPSAFSDCRFAASSAEARSLLALCLS